MFCICNLLQANGDNAILGLVIVKPNVGNTNFINLKIDFMAVEMMDFGLDDGEDLAVAGGDFMVLESTGQHQRQLLLNNKGDFKESPTLCVGAFGYLDDEQVSDLIREVSVEFARDGMDVVSIKQGANGVLVSDAIYK